MTPGERLKAWREEQGLSQTDAGAKVGVTQPTWSDWEADKKVPHIHSAIKIAKLTKGKCPIEMWAALSARPKSGTDG